MHRLAQERRGSPNLLHLKNSLEVRNLAIELNVISSNIAHLRELCDALEDPAFNITPHYSFEQFMSKFNRYKSSYVIMVPESETSPQVAELLGFALCSISFTDMFVVFAPASSQELVSGNQREDVMYSCNPSDIKGLILRRQLSDIYDISRQNKVGGQAFTKAMPRPTSITKREHEVALLICQGLSNKHIARELEISHRTVEVHRSRLMHKLGARNVADFAVKYMWNKPNARESS